MIICCGPIGSGTRLLTAIVASSGLEVWHTSLPSGPNGMPYGTDEPLQWWARSDFREDVRFVVITRRPDYLMRSIMARVDIPDVPKEKPVINDYYDRAVAILAGIPYAYWLTYEALVAEPVQQIENLEAWLGAPIKWTDRIYDGNAKWR